MSEPKIKEARAEMVALEKLMSDKGFVAPEAQYQISGSGELCVLLQHNYNLGPRIDPGSTAHYMKHIFGSDDVIDKARAFLLALPSPKEAAQTEFLAKVTDALEFGKDNNIADEYVAPLRQSREAMTTNLLTKEVPA